MATLVVPAARKLTNLDAIAALAAYATAKAKLFSNDFTPNSQSVIGDFVESVVGGYAGITITWSDAFFDGSGFAVVSSGELLFIQTGAPNGTAFGVFLTDAAGTGLLASARFDAGGFNFTGAGTTLPVIIKLEIDTGLLSISPAP